jgi:hypothetical protein
MPIAPATRIKLTTHARDRYCERVAPIHFDDLLARVKAARPARGRTLRQFRATRGRTTKSLPTIARADDDAVYVLRRSEDVLVLVTVLNRAEVLASK